MPARLNMTLFHQHLAFISCYSSSSSAPGTLASLLFLKPDRHAPALEPLLSLFPLLGVFFCQTSIYLIRSSLPSSLYSNLFFNKICMIYGSSYNCNWSLSPPASWFPLPRSTFFFFCMTFIYLEYILVIHLFVIFMLVDHLSLLKGKPHKIYILFTAVAQVPRTNLAHSWVNE